MQFPDSDNSLTDCSSLVGNRVRLTFLTPYCSCYISIEYVCKIAIFGAPCSDTVVTITDELSTVGAYEEYDLLLETTKDIPLPTATVNSVCSTPTLEWKIYR